MEYKRDANIRLTEQIQTINNIIMKTKSFMRIALVACIFWTIAGCNGITPSQPNVYVNVEDSRHPGFALRFVSYVPTGDNAHNGKNILGLIV